MAKPTSILDKTPHAPVSPLFQSTSAPKTPSRLNRSFMIDADLDRDLAMIAAKVGKTKSEILSEALRAYLAQINP